MIRAAALSSALVLLSLAATGGIAAAQTTGDHDPNLTTFAQDVGYTTGTLADPQQATKLLARIEIAADQVCGGAPSASSGYSARMEYADCKKSAMTQAVQSMHSAMLTALAAGDHAVVVARN